jgi:L-ascorbate metabolism protein UlaG (beta-lactamase superfamily)
MNILLPTRPRRTRSPVTWRRRALGLFAFILGALFVAVGASSSWFASFGGKLEGARLERARRSPHFREGKFVNPVPTHMLVPGTFWEMIRHQLFGAEQRVPPGPLPVVKRTASDYATPPASGLRVTWIGHASTLVEIDGARVLTDPIFSERCSPSTLAGPIRFHPPPMTVGELPAIDAVVISHDHFDHLDMATVKALAGRGTRFVVPLGIGAHLEAWGVAADRMTELDWGESAHVGSLTLTATPARHYSGRNPLRGDRTLWASWIVAGPVHRFFFSGDSGSFDGFKAIGAEFGPFDLTLVKIGACDKTWQEIHMSPAEAVQVHQDLRGRLLMPVHWGTFNLAYHAWNAPADEVLEAATRTGVSLIIPRPGQLVEPATPPTVEAWWR